MATHLALLRGVNVGGHNKVAMADLRRLVEALGHTEVTTYIQSGNVVFSTGRDAATVAGELEGALAREFGVHSGVVVLTRQQLAAAVAANPFPEEHDPRHLHGVFRMSQFDAADRAAIAEAVRWAGEKGTADEAKVVGRTLYLRTPNGLGRSELAARLARLSPEVTGTARNWATVTKLLELLGA